MLGTVLLVRGARQRGLGSRAAAAATAAWRLLHPVESTVSDCAWSINLLYKWMGGLGGSNGGSSGFSSSFSSSFSSGPVAGSMAGIGPDSSGGCHTLADGPDAPSKRRGKPSSTARPQPQLQAWLQQGQGLAAKAADQHARRLARVFGSQQAALEGLPDIFNWCRGRGLTGLQTAQLLDHMATKRHENVVQFTALVQPVWQLMDSYVAAWEEQQRRVGDSKLRKHSSLAEVLCNRSEAAQALGMPPGHVEAWLAAVSEQMSAAAIGRLLLMCPNVVTGSPSTALAAISWAADVLGATDPAAFFAGSPDVLKYNVCTLQRNLDNLQQAVGAGQARQLVLKLPNLLTYSQDTVQASLAWLRQLFPDAKQLAGILDRGPSLLTASVQHLQGNADYLGRALGWQDSNNQLAAFIEARPASFATINLSSEDTPHKLLLLGEVVGVSVEQCLSTSVSYLHQRLDNIAARYMLVQARAPELLYSRSGNPHLSWITNANKPHNLRRLGMTRAEFNAFVRGWPASEEGRRLLEGLRAGSVEGWPQPLP